MQDVAPTDRLQGRSAITAALSGNRAGGSLSVDRLGQIFSARELKAAFAAIAANNLLEGDVLVGLDPVPDRGGDRLAEVFQGLLLPWRIVPKIKRFLGWR